MDTIQARLNAAAAAHALTHQATDKTAAEPASDGELTQAQKQQKALDTLYAAGHYFLQKNRVQDALIFFRMMLVTGPEDERGFLAMGHCHELLGSQDLAMEIYGTGVQIATKKVRTFCACARIVERSGNSEKADQILAEALGWVSDDDEAELIQNEQLRRAS
jgi:cytochrome c-type biogenesis protein CcmH/NrfG